MNEILKIAVPQAFGLLGMFFLFALYQQTDRKKLLIGKLCADVCWVLHYVILGAYEGAIPNFVGIFREIVFVNSEKKKWARSVVFPILFILINWTLSAFRWKSGGEAWEVAVRLLPIFASTFVTISLWVKSPRLTKMISVPVSICFIIYDVYVGSWIGIVNESVAIISIAISFARQHFAQVKAENKA